MESTPLQKNEMIEEMLKTIRDTEEFTCTYWWPLFLEAQKNTMETPTQAAIIMDIIHTRNNFVCDLKERVRYLAGIIENK